MANKKIVKKNKQNSSLLKFVLTAAFAAAVMGAFVKYAMDPKAMNARRAIQGGINNMNNIK